jgi:hypothetical protein
MASKVAHMLHTAGEHPGLVIRIFSAAQPRVLHRVLVDPGYAAGTRIAA